MTKFFLEDYFSQHLHASPPTLPLRAHPPIAICTEHMNWKVTSMLAASAS
jgi:hypothetical protein